MDEVAFVESLFQPELRSSPHPSPTQSLLISASVTPTAASLPSSQSSSPRHRSFKFMTANMAPSASPGTLRVGVGPEEEEVFRQLLNEHEFDDSLSMAAHAESMVDHLHGANLLEPIELPKNGIGAMFDPTFKDVFLNMVSPIAASPCGYPFKVFTPTDHTPRSVLDPHRTPRNGIYNDSLIPVQPLGNPVTTTQSISAIQALQQALWSNNPNGNVHRLNPNSIKDVMRAATTASAARSATAPSPTIAVPRNQYGMPPPSIWVPTTLLTPTSVGQPAPDLTRNISSKKSKAKKPTRDPVSRPTGASSALSASLGTPVSTKAKATPTTRAPKASVQKPSPQLSIPAVELDSDEAESKSTKGKKCVEEGCVRRAQSNSRCKAHGGGARCQFDGPGGCTRSSQGGGYCRAHGGGKRCEYPGCTRGQQRKGRCYVHGGIRKCQTDGCEKKDRGNGFCISHGGGKRCVFPGCSKSVRRGNLCQTHEDVGSASSV